MVLAAPLALAAFFAGAFFLTAPLAAGLRLRGPLLLSLSEADESDESDESLSLELSDEESLPVSLESDSLLLLSSFFFGVEALRAGAFFVAEAAAGADFSSPASFLIFGEDGAAAAFFAGGFLALVTSGSSSESEDEDESPEESLASCFTFCFAAPAAEVDFVGVASDFGAAGFASESGFGARLVGFAWAAVGPPTVGFFGIVLGIIFAAEPAAGFTPDPTGTAPVSLFTFFSADSLTGDPLAADALEAAAPAGTSSSRGRLFELAAAGGAGALVGAPTVVFGVASVMAAAASLMAATAEIQREEKSNSIASDPDQTTKCQRRHADTRPTAQTKTIGDRLACL